MNYWFSILILFLFVIFINSGNGQNKPDGLVIKTTIPDNPIMSIKNDEYNPNAIVSGKEYGPKEIDYSSSSQYTKPKLKQLDKSVFDIDAFQTLIESGNEQYLGHCVVTERTGSTAGTIWVVAGIRSNSAGNDKIGIFKTDPTGWILQTYIYTQRYLGYSIDAEIIEKDTGEKALWIVTETQQSLFAKREVYFVGLNLANLFQGTVGILNWPGAGPNDEYYNPRITTDNYDFPDNPWIYVVASLDSLTFDNKHVNAQKFAYISSAHDPGSMQIHYRLSIMPVYWPNGGTTETYHLYSDIAYYRLSSTPGSVRLIITYSNVPDNTKIWLSTCNSSGFDAQFVGTISGHADSPIGISAIASPGGGLSQQLMVVFEENYQNSGDWDLVSARSNDAGNTWNLDYVDGYSSTTDRIPYLFNMVSRKGFEDEYYVSYALDLPADSIMSTRSNNGVSNYWDQRVRMDGVYPPTYIYSSVGITNTPDERVTVWSSLTGSSNFNLIGSFWPNLPSEVEDEIENNPTSFHLFQNYPNPFNPTTNISFRISEFGHVSLKVFDILGREVAVLVDEEKPAGSYTVTFDAEELPSGVYYYQIQTGGVAEAKKMMLIK